MNKAVKIVFIALLLWVFMFFTPTLSDPIFEALGIEEDASAMRAYIKGLPQLASIAPYWDEMFGMGTLVTILEFVMGFLRGGESLKKKDVEEVVGKIVLESDKKAGPSAEEVGKRLLGKEVIICPSCGEWNAGDRSTCRACRGSFRRSRVPPARIPMKKAFDMLVEYYSERWGKYAEKKLREDILQAGASPEEAIIGLTDKIRKGS